MKEQLITFETAKLAKKKGFDIPVHYCFNKDGILSKHRPLKINWNWKIYKTNRIVFSAPTQSLLQKWLREEHNLILIIKYRKDLPNQYGYHLYNRVSLHCSDNYEEALEIGLIETLKRIKDKYHEKRTRRC